MLCLRNVGERDLYNFLRNMFLFSESPREIDGRKNVILLSCFSGTRGGLRGLVVFFLVIIIFLFFFFFCLGCSNGVKMFGALILLVFCYVLCIWIAF